MFIFDVEHFSWLLFVITFLIPFPFFIQLKRMRCRRQVEKKDSHFGKLMVVSIFFGERDIARWLLGSNFPLLPLHFSHFAFDYSRVGAKFEEEVGRGGRRGRDGGMLL